MLTADVEQCYTTVYYGDIATMSMAFIRNLQVVTYQLVVDKDIYSCNVLDKIF